MKRIVSLLLTVVMVVAIFTTVPVFAAAASTGDLGTGVYWSYDSETATLHLSGEGEIPFYDTQPDIPWWNYSDEIENVSIEEGITTIASLEKLSQLKEISLPDSVTKIAGSAFYGCYSLETVNLSENIKTISNHAFDGCESLKSFTINGDINGKGSPFTDSAGNITGDGYFVRDGVLFANSNTYVDNNLSVKKINHNSLIKYPSGRTATSYVIPTTTMEIKSDAFSSVKNLRTVTIPSSVVSFYVRSFVGYGEAFEKSLTLIFQHDTYPADTSYSAVRNLVAGSKVVVKNEEAKKSFIEKSSSFIYNSGGAQNVTIVAAPNPTTNLAITSAPKSLNVGETGIIEVLQTPYNTTDNITFTSSNESIVSFDKYICGQITAHKPGTATITVTSGSVSKTHTITVNCKHSRTHTVNSVTPTCSKAGYTGDTLCYICGSIVGRGTSIEKTEHPYSDEWTIDIPATCISEGSKSHPCTLCNEKTDVTSIPVTGHTVSSWVVELAATCTSTGSKHKECTVCGEIIETAVIPVSDEHTASKWIIDKEATCTESGSRYRECTVCGEILERESFATTEHTPSDWIVDTDATCIVAGSKHKECMDCGQFVDVAEIPIKSHVSSDWIIDIYATLNDVGLQHKECIECGITLKSALIPQLKPATPKLSTIANTLGGVKVTWGKVSGADEYKVYRKTYNAKTKAWSGWSRIATGVTSTSYVDKTAKSGTYYRYTVIASNEAGNSSYDATGLKTYFLATPTVSATNSNSGVTVKWSKSAGATGYYVYRKTGTGNWQKIATVKGTSKVSYTDTKAKSGVTYRYTVKAYYSSYVSAYNTNGFAVRRLTTPTLKSVTSAKAGVTFKWNKVTGATGYIVYRKTGNGSWQKIATVKGNTKVSYLDKTAKKGVTYTYTVRAYYGTSTSYYNTKGLTIKDKY